MQVTYYGHSCFGITLQGARILFDPFISPNKLAAAVRVDDISADFILISHGHEDHMADAVSIAGRTGATIIGAFELTSWMEKQGVSSVHPMNIGGQKMFPFGKVKMVNAVHSSTLPDGTPAGPAAGFLIQTPEITFYYAGDTALHYDMKLLGKHYKVDLAFLPVGDNFTMGAEDAVIASRYIKCDRIVGMHYDTFGYITINHDEARKHFENEDKTLYLLPIGETTNF